MPEPRARRAPKTAGDNELGARWAAALGPDAPLDDLKSEILAESPDRAAPAVRSLGTQAGEASVSLLASLAREGAPSVAEAAVEALGNVRASAAADALDELATGDASRALQKSARRSLYRLASQGIHPTVTHAPTVATVGDRRATLYRVIASAYDGSGSRVLWMAAERAMGGIYLFALVLNDVNGLDDLVVRDTTRKRFVEQEAEMRERDITAWVELPVDYARQLVQEAVDTSRATSRPVPTVFSLWADLIASAERPFEKALVYEELSAFEMRMHPTLEGETPRLFEQPEIEPWFFSPDRVRKYLVELTRPATSRLIVTPESDAERQARIFREAARELLPARALHALRRRLEETAYVFLRTDRDADARRAVAAAATIEEERPLRPPHPFVQALIERSLQIAVEVERTGFEPMRLSRAT